MQDEIDKTKKGIDDLRDAIKEINGEIPEFTKGLQEGLTEVAKKLPDVVDSIVKLNAENRKLVAEGGKPKSVLSQLAGSMFTLNTAVSIGATLLITYGGEIFKWVTNLINGENKLSSFAKAMKDAQIINQGLIDTQLKARKAAQAEITDLDLLYKAALNDGKAKKGQKDAVLALQEQWPDRFKNMTAEAIMAGKATDAYRSLKKELIDVAYAEAAKNKMVENSSRILDNEQKIAKARSKNLEIRSREKIARDDFNNADSTPSEDGGYTTHSLSVGRLEEIEAEKALSDKEIYALNTDNLLLNKQNEKLATDVNKLIEKRGASVLGRGKRSATDQVTYNNVTTQNNRSMPAQPTGPTESQVRKESADRMALLTLQGYAREIEETNQHFEQLKKEHKGNNATLEQLEREHQATLNSITQKFQNEGLSKLAVYGEELKKTSVDTHAEALMQITEEYRKKATEVDEIKKQNQALAQKAEEEIFNLSNTKLNITSQSQIAQIDVKIKALELKRTEAQTVVDQATLIAKQLSDKRDTDSNVENKKFADERKQAMFEKDKGTLEDNVSTAQANGNWQQEFAAKQQLLNREKQQALDAAKDKNEKTAKIERDYKQKQDALDQARLDTQVANQKKYVKGLETLSQAVTAIFGKNTIAARLAFKAHQAAAAANVIIDTRQAIMGIWKANAGLPLVGTAKAIVESAIVAATGASNLAAIMKQKPGFARGGQYTSDGRGALLPGYSRTDNTNAYLRSGEAVVVSEAMRNPWARNLVSAINVAHGGRDFSIPNPGRGYAIGGIFTDGGNANRYYSAPVNDQKDLANTLAYQMLNNFPPIYVDVKDVNNQQNILAQTVNRVTL